MNGCSCGTVEVFETVNVLTRGGMEPTTFGMMPNDLTIWVIGASYVHWDRIELQNLSDYIQCGNEEI